jgi:hypothetical protein
VRHENFTWPQVESTNYADFVKNLRAIACPEQTIRDIITSEVGRLYAHRKLSEVAFPSYEWWRSEPDPEAERIAAEKIQGLELEKHELLTSILGAGWDLETKEAIAARGGITLTGPVLGEMSAPSRRAALDVIAAAQLKIEAYQEQQRLSGSPIDPMQMARLREEQLVTLASILTQEEYDEFVLRYSPAAQQLREQARGMNLSAAQFRGLYNALFSILGQPVYFYNGTDAGLLKQQEQLQAQAEAVIRETVGAQFYASFQLSQDPLYRSAQAVTQQLNVPASAVMPIYQINRATQAELNRIRNDDSLSNDEKVTALAQAQVEQQQSLEQILGPEAFQHWLQTQGRSQ